MHEFVHEFTESITMSISQRVWLAPLMAFFAGILSSITPCCLSAVPLIVGYVGGTSDGTTGKAFRLSVTFVCGTAVTFVALGIAASLLGEFLHEAGRWWYIFLGVLMVLMALQAWDVINVISSTYLTSKNKMRGYIGAFAAGMLGGIFSSPCATPILVVLLGIAAQIGNVVWSVLLLLVFSMGHGILVIAAGTSYGFVEKLASSGKYGTFSKVVKVITGVLILLIGVYMFYSAFLTHSD